MGRRGDAALTSVYVIGSLRDRNVPLAANALRRAGYAAFDGWYSAGPEADDRWRDHEHLKGSSYPEALADYAARNVFAFDRFHLGRCHAAVLVLPAGRSCHLEAGTTAPSKPVYALLPDDAEPERWDVMTQFLDGVHNLPGVLAALGRLPGLTSIDITHDDAAWLAGVLSVTDPLHIDVARLLIECNHETATRIAKIVGAGTPIQGYYVCTNAPLIAELLRVLRPYLGARLRAHLQRSYAHWLVGKDEPTRSWWARALHIDTWEYV